MSPLRSILAALALAALLTPAHADTVTTPAASFTGTLNGLRRGKLSLTPKTGPETLFDLADISSLALDQYPKLADAERWRADPLRALFAAAAYKSLIPTLNQPELRLLIEWRAIDPTDRDNRWTEAVALFLDVYLASPTDAVWKGRPTHFPTAPSRMLADSADQVVAAINAAPSDDARKNLRAFLLDIYTRAGDTPSAQRLAREIAGTPDPSPASAPSTPPINPATLAAINSALAAVHTALDAKNYPDALRQIDALLPTAAGEPAVQLFTLKARALESQNQLEPAAAAWLRIPAHYPASPAAPAALLHAADLQQKLHHPAEAQSLLDALRTQYPATPEAASLKPK